MANILLTTRCNRACPYCFARQEMSDSASDTLMSWENLIYIADFLAAAGERQISLLGGEPTLHPECVDFILYLLEKNFQVMVFTNGMLTAERLEEFQSHLTKLSPDRLNFTCNLNDPEQTPASAAETARVDNFLSVMGPWTMPGFNIYRLDFTLDFLFAAIQRYRLKRQVRLGICHPVPGQEAGFIRMSDMRQVVQRLYAYRPQFDALRISLGLDCGFPMCQFNDEELGWLHRHPGCIQFSCGPAVDITPDMEVYYCFPLSRYQRKSLFDFDSLAEIKDHLVKMRDEIRAHVPGVYEHCGSCLHLADGLCAGGGLCRLVSHRMDENANRSQA